ncbi:aldo/keto reductase [Planktothrix mougeotii]|uniref:Aldo/keto reductase n=1 Tax=Planktothrix mougeotii LEGE 06226 TaxID=1828728 RepID=A0ABR9U6A0_9CYAN|nr:aldo/keto reductase [Planktothrix mougeotii]MBE9141993.1 aldo/keto reductase [Planktothrix mougeotii LEGE 06226]
MQITTLQNKTVAPLGLASVPDKDMDPRCPGRAAAAGIDYFFFYNLSYTSMIDGLKPLLAERRDTIAVATGSLSRGRSDLRSYLDQVRITLDTEVIDVFYAEWIRPDDDMDQVLGEVLDELHRWKEQGIIRYVGASVHNRPLALALLASDKVEVLMHRYNMAHRGAEEAVLPTALQLDVPVVAYTCTRWGSLLQGHDAWTGDIPAASDCYRYSLDHPAIHLALTAPATLEELEQNLDILHNQSLDPTTKRRWEEYGTLIYGDGRDAFETKWL